MDFTELLKSLFTDGIEGKDINEVLTAYQSAVDSAVSENEAGLKKSRDTLLSEKKQLQKQLKEFDGVDLEVYNTLKSEAEERQLIIDAGGDPDENSPEKTNAELQKLRIELARANKKLEAAQTEYTGTVEEKDGRINLLQTKLFDTSKATALDNAFNSFNIKNEHRSILRDAFKTRTQVDFNDDGEIEVAIVGDDGVPLPIDDFFKSWSGTENAKPYIGAPKNAGGGANGTKGAGSGDGPQEPIEAYKGMFVEA